MQLCRSKHLCSCETEKKFNSYRAVRAPSVPNNTNGFKCEWTKTSLPHTVIFCFVSTVTQCTWLLWGCYLHRDDTFLTRFQWWNTNISWYRLHTSPQVLQLQRILTINNASILNTGFAAILTISSWFRAVSAGFPTCQNILSWKISCCKSHSNRVLFIQCSKI